MSDHDDFDPENEAPDAPASEGEIAASQRLRDALEGGAAPDPNDDAIALALALKAAWQPETLSTDESHAVIDAVPTETELRRAATLRDALASGVAADDDASGASFAPALRAAVAPPEIDAAAHQALIDGALAAPAHELAAAATLRDALSGRAVEEDPIVTFAAALKAAYAPTALGIAEHKALVEAALTKMPARRRSNVVRVTFGAVATGLALAAAIFLALTQAPLHEARPGKSLARARTTQPLFDEPFKTGETSARIDRIASARAADYRDNRFSKWGVR